MNKDLLEKLRHPKFIDLNPHAGNSWWGLTRNQAKTVGMTLIIYSILLMDIFTSLDDWVNVITAKFVISLFHIDASLALLLTYTFIPWVIFLCGIWIFPMNTETLFNGYINKLKRFVQKQLKNPVVVILWIILFYITFNFYKTLL